MVGLGKDQHTSKCTSSKGFVARLTGTLMNLCMSGAWMQTVHIESLCVYPTIRDFIAVALICGSRPWHVLVSGIVRDFRVDIVFAVIGALDDSILGSIVGVFVGCAIVGTIVGSVIICSIVGSAIVGSIVDSLIIRSLGGSAISTLEL
jgi:hypothetical protein